MSNAEPTKRKLIPGVSRWYRYDWQYAADLNRIPLVQEAAFLISLTPFFVPVSAAVFPKSGTAANLPPFLWMLWGAALAFLIARVLYYFACPKFIREYRDFGQYAARQHSHRWIVWEFYLNLTSLSGWQRIVEEVSPKGLTVDIGELPRDLAQRLSTEFADASMEELKVFKPVNIDRDIYLPILARGKKLALLMQEGDSDLPKKEKELFWILYSQAAKERPRVRVVYWVLIAIAFLLAVLVALGELYCIFTYLRA